MTENNMTPEERIEKIKNLLSQKNGVIDQEIKDEIFKITTQKKLDKTNNVIKEISNIKNFDSKDIVQNLTNIDPPDFVKESIRKTLSSIIDPIRTTFMVEIAKYVDAISSEQESTKVIPRAVKAKTIKKIENGKFVPAGGEELVINPEFKQLLATGYKPKDAQIYQQISTKVGENNPFLPLLLIDTNNSGSLDLGTPESEYLKNGIGGEQPSNKTETITTSINTPAGLFVKSFEDIESNVNYVSELGSKEIKLQGNLYKQQKLNSLKNSTASDIPDWTISYKEKGRKYYFDVRNNFEYLYNNKITINTSSYSFIGDLNSSLSQAEKDYLRSINLSECEEFDNDELYSYLMFGNISDVFDKNLNNQQQQRVKTQIRNIHPRLVQNIISSFMSSYIKNRLLSKFKLPNIEGLESTDLEKTNLIILNLLNFIPEASEELKACGKQPHPLNLDLVVDLMIKKFNETGFQTIPNKEYCSDASVERPKNPITEATYIAIVIMISRITILENLLKSLFILDTHAYSSELIDSGLLPDYLYVKVIESLSKYNLLENFQELVEQNYDFFKKNNLIKEEDEQGVSSITSCYFNEKKLENESRQFKIFIKSLSKRTINYLKKLIGSSFSTIGKKSILRSLTGDITYDLPDLYLDTSILQSTDDNVRKKRSRINKLKTEESTDFFILERYIDIGDLFRQEGFQGKEQKLIDLQTKYLHIKGCVRLDAYQEFLNKFINEDLTSLNIEDIASNIGVGIDQNASNNRPRNNNIVSVIENLETFLIQPKLGIRLVQVSKTQDVIPFSQLLDPTNQNVPGFIENKLRDFLSISDQNIKLDLNKVQYKKMYSFFDVNYNEENVVYYNSIPIIEQEKLITYSELYDSDNSKIKNLINDIYTPSRQQLLDGIANNELYKLIINKCLMIDKIPNLAIVYSNSALSTSAMENLFTSSKNKLIDLYDTADNIKNYKYKNNVEKNGGISSKYKQDLDNIGNPLGGPNLDVLQFLITTPILILKGITQLMDPNIAIASQIVNAAGAGLLFPKFENNQPVYPGEKVILPTALASMALLPINLLPPGFGIGPPVTPLPGMLYWGLEPLLWKLPFFQNQAANSDEAKRIRSDPNYGGLRIGDPDNFSCDVDQDE